MEIYLDNCATTKTCGSAVNAALNAMNVNYGNPSSLHKKGFVAENTVNHAKDVIANELCCDSREIYFTSGATESNNLAIIGSAIAGKRKGNRIVVSSIEHPSVKEAVLYLKNQGYDIVEVSPNKSGFFTANDFAKETDEKTILVICMLVNNETGLILPVYDIAKAVKFKNPNTLVHVDAVQGFLKIPIKLKNSYIDMMSISGHKVSAPKGIGVLYKKRCVRIIPQSYGGGQQDGLRNGTECVPLIAAFEAATTYISDNMGKNSEHYKKLNEYLILAFSQIEDISINSNENCVDYIINFSVKGIRSEVMLHYLEQFEIYVSSGSACAKGKHSYVLEQLGFASKDIDTAIRISFSDQTSIEMLEYFVEKLKDGISTLAKIR